MSDTPVFTPIVLIFVAAAKGILLDYQTLVAMGLVFLSPRGL